MKRESQFHKHLMRVSKTGLILVTILIIIGLLLYLARFYKIQSSSQLIMIMDILRNKDTILSPTLAGRTEIGDNYNIHGDVAYIRGNNKEKIEIIHPVINIKTFAGKNIKITAQTAEYHVGINQGFLKENVRTHMETYTFLFKSLWYNLQTQDMHSDEPMSGGNDTLHVNAQGLNYLNGRDWITFKGYADITIRQQKENTTKITMIHGDERIDLDNKNKVIIAWKNAVITDSDSETVLKGQTITLWQKKGRGKEEIEHIEAKGEVSIQTPKGQATGQHMLYNTIKGEGILTGNPAIVTTPTQTMHAKKNIIYDEKNNTILATGKVFIKDADYTMRGESARITLQEENNKKEIETIEFFDNVEIEGDKSKILGSYAIYTPKNHRANVIADEGEKTRIEKEGANAESCGIHLNTETKLITLIPCTNQPIEGVIGQERSNP